MSNPFTAMDITSLPPGYKHTTVGRQHAVYYGTKANMLFSAVAADDGLHVEWFCSDDAAHLGETTARAMATEGRVSDIGMILIASLAKHLNATRLVISNASTPLGIATTRYGTFD